MTWARAQATLLSALIALAGCAPGTTTPAAVPASDTPSERLVIVGRIVTMADPPVAEALLIDDGIVTALGTRDEVLTLAGDGIPVVDIGTNVAYPGFIDAHAHWIGDRSGLWRGDAGGGHGRCPQPRLDIDLGAVGEPGEARRARGPRRRGRAAAPGRCVPRPQRAGTQRGPPGRLVRGP